jgi:DNA-binding NarL/FixJ family response regulator
VENLKRRVYAKLDVSSSVHAVAKAASLGMLDEAANAPTQPLRKPAWAGQPAARRPQPDPGSVVLAVVSGQYSSALDQVVSSLVAAPLPFVLIKESGPVADSHWARWHRGPIVAVLVDPGAADWDMVAELGIPAILVHSKPLDPPELAEALACGASSLVPADRIEDHFLSVLRMVGQGYLVVDSMPMRPLIGAVRARWDERAPGQVDLPELTARESDILSSLSSGHSIRQTARALGIAPKTVENVQTRLFRKLGVRNRSGALAVADAFGLLPGDTTAGGSRPLAGASDSFPARSGYPSLQGDNWGS